MSRDRQKRKLSVPRSRKSQPDPYTTRILKEPSKRELEATLKHAVRNQDFDALEDYDEENPRPPTGAIAPLVEVPDIDIEPYLEPDDPPDWLEESEYERSGRYGDFDYDDDYDEDY